MTRRHIAVAAVAFLCYLVLACLLYWPVSPLDGHHLVGCACSDPVQEVWFLRWTSFAIAHGHNPLFTHYLNQPFGANLAVNTSMPLLGTLAWPISHVTNPIAAYNALLRLGIGLSAWSMFLVLRRYTQWIGAAFVGGLLFGFSAFVTAHAQRHLFLVFLPLVPLFIPLLDDWLVSRRRSAVRSGIALGIVAALQFLISPEVLLLVVIGAVCSLAFLALRDRAFAWDRLRRAGIGFACVLGVFLLVDGYPLWMLLAGPQRPIGPPHPVVDLARYHADLLSTILPSQNALFAPAGFVAPNTHLLVEIGQEDGFYLGIPLAVLLIYGIWRLRSDRLVLGATVLGVAGFVLGLGTPLTLGGRRLMPFLFRIIQVTPVLQNLEAARFSLLLQLGAATVFAVVVDRWRRYGAALSPPEADSAVDAGGRRRVVTISGIVLVCLIPAIPRGVASVPADVPALFTTSAAQEVPQGALTLTLPLTVNTFQLDNRPMLWQAMADMRFRTFGGDVFTRSPTEATTLQPLPDRLVSLLAPQFGETGSQPGDAALLAEFVQQYGVRFVLVDSALPGSLQFISLAFHVLGPPTISVGGILGWSVGIVTP